MNESVNSSIESSNHEQSLSQDNNIEQGSKSQQNNSNTTTIENIDKYYYYQDIVENFIDNGYNTLAIGLIDINGDDTYELAIMTDGDIHGQGAYLYTIIDNKVIQIITDDSDNFGQYGGFTYYQGQNCFRSDYDSINDESSNEWTCFYSIDESGKASLLCSLYRTVNFENDSTNYYVNNSEVSKNEFEKVVESYSVGDEKLFNYYEANMIHTLEEFNDYIDSLNNYWII